MALTKTGAALKGYGNSYSETIGLITAGTEMLPNQASKVARGWRTIGANVLKLAQSEDTLSAANGKVNISLRDSQGNMKSTFAILQDLHKGVEGQSVAWKDLSQEEQSSISLMLAGKTQTEVFKSTMDNFTQAIKANKTAQKSQGSAAQENAKYLDSIQGHMSLLTTAWENLSHHLLDSNTFKSLIDIGTDIINVIDKIISALDKLPGKLGAIVGIAGALGAIISGKKLFNIATGLVDIGKAGTGAAKSIEAVGEAASVASGAKGLGSLKSMLGILTNPAVLGGLAALAVTIAAIEWDKYFNFDNSIKRFNEYKDKLKSIKSEIEQLEIKRDSDEGLTNAEKTHLAVLKAEERSLRNQIVLEKERIQTAFKADVNTKQGKKYQERTGPTQLLDYQDARKQETVLYDKIAEKQKMISDAEQKLQEARESGNKKMEKRYQNVLDVFNKELGKLDSQQTKLAANTAKSAQELAKYWEDVSANVDYSSLSQEDKKAFDDIHKAFIESQIDASNLKDSYSDVSNALNSAMDSLGHQNLKLFDDIDVSSIQTVEDAVNAIKKQIQSLGKDAEIKFKVKDDNGELKTITKKVSELTDEDYESIIHFNETGIEEVEEDVEQASENKEAVIDVIQNGAGAVSSIIDDAARSRDSDVNVSDNNTANSTGSIIDAIASKARNAIIQVQQNGASAVQGVIDSIKGKDVFINIYKTIFNKEHATGKRKGEQGGVAWLGDEGTAQNPKPELVVGEDGAYLAGTGGWELYDVKSSDTVYTYAQTKKLLSGKQTFSGVASELPRFKKGKKKTTKSTPATNANVNKAQTKVNKAKNKKAKEKAKKALEKLQKQREKKRNEFDSKVAQLKHNAKVNHWTDAEYQAEYTKLYNQYNAYLSGDQSNTYTEDHDEYLDTLAKDESERLVGLVSVGGMTAASAVSNINAQTHLTADEKKDYRAKAYKSSVEYNLKEYQNGKATRQQVLNDIQNYYKERGKYDEDYYKMVDELREADKAKELKRLNELQEKEKGKLSYIKKYAQQQKDYYDEQVAKEKEEAEELETLIELQDKLNNAKKTMVKVYREGVGFVYEQDTQAIREAQKALEDYNKEQQKSDLEQKAEAWQKIIDAIGEAEDLSEMKELELALGITNISQITGNIGLDANKWGNLAKTILATQMGLEDISKILSEAEGADIEKLIGATLSAGNKQISNSLLSQYFAKHSFASGTLSSPSGFSIVGENGPELRYLSSGSAIFSNRTSRNLMEWGQYSPAQVLSNMLGGTQSQVFNFDKIVLPNVHNADEFYKELQALPNRAIQQSTFRM